MFTSLGRLVLLVHDYDDALRFYSGKLGFEVLADVRTPEGERFLHIYLPRTPGIGIWFIEATTDEQRQLVGKQTGQEPCFVLYTDNCQETYKTLLDRGVPLRKELSESQGYVAAHFEDLYGNEFVVVELRDS